MANCETCPVARLAVDIVLAKNTDLLEGLHVNSVDSMEGVKAFCSKSEEELSEVWPVKIGKPMCPLMGLVAYEVDFGAVNA